MFLKALGWNPFFENSFLSLKTAGKFPARVSREFRGAYRLFAERGEIPAQLSGKLRFGAGQPLDLPAVGDWIGFRPGQGEAIIESILPRKTVIVRKRAGRKTGQQILACNVDFVFITTSLNHDLNFRRLERYLSMCWESGATPVILLTKADLCSQAEIGQARADVERTAIGVNIHPVSAISGQGLTEITAYLSVGKTAVFLGSSGVGKSTLINGLIGNQILDVKPIRAGDDRGRHATTSRQMIPLPGSGIVIDTPGLRELQPWDSSSGVDRTFSDIHELSCFCRFRDCRHDVEPECAVLDAVQQGRLPEERLLSFRKLVAELHFIESKNDFFKRRAAKNRARFSCREQKRYYKRR